MAKGVGRQEVRVGGGVEGGISLSKTIQRSFTVKTRTPEQSIVSQEAPMDTSGGKGTIPGRCHLFGTLHRRHCMCQFHIYTVFQAALGKAD